VQPSTRPHVLAFAVGAATHLALLALAYAPAPFGEVGAMAMFVAAPAGLVVDMSAEVLQPSRLGSVLLVTIASVVNGAVYVGLAALARRLRRAVS
jgi:hypothetical protein